MLIKYAGYMRAEPFLFQTLQRGSSHLSSLD